MSKKQKKSQAAKLNFTPVYILSVLAAAAVISMVVTFSVTGSPKQGKFIPPPFEDAAIPMCLRSFSIPHPIGMEWRTDFLCAQM